MNKSIYEMINNALIDGELPRDFRLSIDDEDLPFAPGAKDGICFYHFKPEEISNEDYEKMCMAIRQASENDFDEANKLFLELSKNNNAISNIDKLQNYIWDNTDNLIPENIYNYAKELITLSDNIECVKYGLSILEMLKTNDDEEIKNIIRTLALYDEFTFFCLYIMKTWQQANKEIFDLVQKVHGWGRIFAVEQLRALDPYYEEIRNWMLKEGINNDVLPSYSALTIWRNGNIGSILYTHPTYEQFAYIRNIIDALLDESAVQGLSALDKRKEIILVFLNEALKMPLILEDYVTIYHIYNYFEEIQDCQEILSLAKKILIQDKARNIILEGIKKGEAIDLGIFLDIDCKPYILKLMKEDFKNKYYLCRYLTDDDEYRKELLKIYKNNLSLKQMISFPEKCLGFGEEYWMESALEFLMQELRNFPFEGKEFIETGLQCKPPRTRNGALTVLQEWVSENKKPLSEILPEFNSLLMMLVALEVDEDIEKRMNQLISGAIDFNDEIIYPKLIDQKTLNILSDAISDVGAWCWWHVDDEFVQLEFMDVQLYDYSKKEKQAHSSTIALRFFDNPFLLVLDNLSEDNDKKWYDKLRDDEIEPFSIESYEFDFNNTEQVNNVIESYRNKKEIKGIVDEYIASYKYIVAAKCNEVAFVAGGNDLKILSHSGLLKVEEIEKANQKWWEYWQDYWRLRESKDAYEKDFACEVTIPVKS